MIRTLWDTTDPTAAAVSNKMTTEAIRALVDRMLKAEGLRKGLDTITRRYKFKSNHGFRKFFQTNVEPKMKSLDVMTLMDQDTGLAASYNKPTVEMLLEEYLKAVGNLITIDKSRISQTVVGKVSENRQLLVAEMHAKDREMEAFKQQQKEKVANLLQEIKYYGSIAVRLENHVETYRKEIKIYKNEVELFRKQYGGRRGAK